jgi:cation:H+ antiporter
VGLARAAGVSSLVIGLTVVAFGTSTPELATSLRATLTGPPDVAVGNVIGSNIFNLGVILGIAAMVCPIAVHRRAIVDGALPMVVVALLPLMALATGGVITWWQGVVMLGLLVVYVLAAYWRGRLDPERVEGEIDEIPLAKKGRVWVSVVLVIAGLGLLVAATPLLVDSSVAIARALGVSELAIALTIVAGGTSAPELVTSLIAAIRRHPDVAVGNVLGSNVFNILAILGACAVTSPQALQRQTIVMDIPVMIGLSVLCVPLMRSGGRLSRVEGVLLLAAWVVYAVVVYAFGAAWFG